MASKKSRSSAAKAGVDAKTNLIRAAESLFGRCGIEHVALQEVALKAGTANKFAVQYHFGDRDQLIRSVFENRLPQLETRRAEMLRKVKARGRLDNPAALLEIIFVPIAEVVDAARRHTYAAFLLSLYESKRDWASRIAVTGLAPLTAYIDDLLAETVPHLSASMFVERRISAMLVFLNLLVRLDEKKISMTEKEAIREALSVSVAILMAPVSASAVRRRASSR